MKEIKGTLDGDGIRIALSGRIDSNNAAEVEKALFSKLVEGEESVVLDAEELEYISSAGLRVILRVKKACPDLKVTGVSPEVYDIFEMTGFTEMMTVEKAYRVVSVEGCEVIGEGFNGKVYRIDGDNVVKTYKNADALAEIRHEREVARLAEKYDLLITAGSDYHGANKLVKIGDTGLCADADLPAGLARFLERFGLLAGPAQERSGR